jgi:hypothetical protein
MVPAVRPGAVTRTHFIPGDFSPNGRKLVMFKGPDGDPLSRNEGGESRERDSPG